MALSEFQNDAILALLLDGHSVRRIATEVGCAEATVWSRLRDPLFNARYHELKGSSLAKQSRKATDIAENALSLLGQLITDVMNGNRIIETKDLLAAVKLASDLGWKFRSEVDIYPRLAALEAYNKERGIEQQIPVAGEIPISGEVRKALQSTLKSD